jgi:hypothetical protein
VKVKTVDRDLIEWLLRFILHSPHLLSKRKVRNLFVILSNAKKLPFGKRGWEKNSPSGDRDGKKTDFTFY